jgi:gliding motility-associated-like protein
VSSSAAITVSNPVIIAGNTQNAACKGIENGMLDVTASGGTPGYKYLWNTGVDVAHVTSVAPGNYSITVTDVGGCTATEDFTVGTEYTLQVNTGGTTSINEGQSAHIMATANTDHNNIYSWSPADRTTCSNCASTAAAPAVTTTFTVSVVDSNGCTASGDITINVNTQINIFIPNAFSPNGDGNNDYFQIFGNLSPVVYLEMSVFDRWGEKIYESQDPQFKWDGVYKGEPEPMGVYLYTMTASFEDGTHQDFKGSVTLVR